MIPPPDPGPQARKIVEWQHDQAQLQHDVIGIGDVQSDTVYGRLLVRSLTRAQLGLSLMCLAATVATIGSFPVIMALLPSARRVRVAGLPLTLVVLGAGIFPVLLAVGWFYNRQASQLEARFIDLVDPPAGGPMINVPAVAAIATVTLLTVAVGARGVRIARTSDDFLVAAREVPPGLNAAAISGEYLSAASFLGIAGLIVSLGLGALWYSVGYTAGYLVLLLLVAAPLRRFGAYTIPDFAEGRLASRGLRQATTVLVLVIGWFYLLPQMKGAGITLQLVLGTPYWIGVVALGVVVSANIAMGGMKGVTFVQCFQYWLKLCAIGIPALVLLAAAGHGSTRNLSPDSQPVFTHSTTVDVQTSTQFTLARGATVRATGRLDGAPLTHQAVQLAAGRHSVGAGTVLVFGTGSPAPASLSMAHVSADRVGLPVPHRRHRRIPPAARHLRRDHRHPLRGHRPAAHPGPLLHQPGR